MPDILYSCGIGIALTLSMPRAKAILQSEFPYSITARCINKEWFSLPMDTVWNIFCEELTRTSKEHAMLIYQFVLMNNHFHLVVSTPKSNISACMHQFMKNTSCRLTKSGNRINATYSGRHYKTILHEYNYIINTYKYIYRNPVEAKICNTVESYRYSSLFGLLHPSELKIPLEADLIFNESPKKTLNWLNDAPEFEKKEAVRCALRRPYFKSRKKANSSERLIGLTGLI